ncbi:unnamed protein product, partial [Prorocentrum cordatum]
ISSLPLHPLPPKFRHAPSLRFSSRSCSHSSQAHVATPRISLWNSRRRPTMMACQASAGPLSCHSCPYDFAEWSEGDSTFSLANGTVFSLANGTMPKVPGVTLVEAVPSYAMCSVPLQPVLEPGYDVHLCSGTPVPVPAPGCGLVLVVEPVDGSSPPMVFTNQGFVPLESITCAPVASAPAQSAATVPLQLEHFVPGPTAQRR